MLSGTSGTLENVTVLLTTLIAPLNVSENGGGNVIVRYGAAIVPVSETVPESGAGTSGVAAVAVPTACPNRCPGVEHVGGERRGRNGQLQRLVRSLRRVRGHRRHERDARIVPSRVAVADIDGVKASDEQPDGVKLLEAVPFVLEAAYVWTAIELVASAQLVGRRVNGVLEAAPVSVGAGPLIVKMSWVIWKLSDLPVAPASPAGSGCSAAARDCR